MGEYDISIDDLLAGNTGTKKETKLEKAKKLILELLGKKENDVSGRTGSRVAGI